MLVPGPGVDRRVAPFTTNGKPRSQNELAPDYSEFLALWTPQCLTANYGRATNGYSPRIEFQPKSRWTLMGHHCNFPHITWPARNRLSIHDMPTGLRDKEPPYRERVAVTFVHELDGRRNGPSQQGDPPGLAQG